MAVGKDQESCEAGGCCWSASPNPNPSHVPWCFKRPGKPAPPGQDPHRYWAQKKSMLLLGMVLTCPGSPMLLQGQELLTYLLRRILVYKPKDLNRDWSPRFSTLRDKNGWIRAKTAGNLNLGVSRNRFYDLLADPDSRNLSRFYTNIHRSRYDSFDFPTPPKLDWSLVDSNAGMLRETKAMIALRSNAGGKSRGLVGGRGKVLSVTDPAGTDKVGVLHRYSDGERNVLFEPFIYKNDLFTKTGSGQT